MQQCSLGAVHNGIRSFFPQKADKIRLCWRAITSWSFFAFLHLLAGKKATWKFLSPGKTPKKFSLVAPRGCWCGLTPGELPSKGKQFPKCHMHGESKGHFLVHVLQLGVYLQLASGILFTKESHTILLIIDDWIRSHNCHEKACHQKKVSCADEQQPVVFTALLLVASLTSWRTITFFFKEFAAACERCR